jgi:arylsulfatase A-like enzyme
LFTALFALPLRADSPKPNIIHIFADDLGFGSVGFNGQTQIATPNLDALAAGGLRFTNAYACSVCAASRASLYTGFHSGHANVDGNSEINEGFRSDEVVTAQVLAAAGYSSAVFGKWGFGASGQRNLTGSDNPPSVTVPGSLPTAHGFSTLYGHLSHGAAQDYFYDYIWRNDSNAPSGVSYINNNGGPGGTPQYTHDLFAAQSEQYIAAHAGDSAPFYMQLNYTIPHWDIDAIASAPGGYGAYASKPGWTDQQKAYAAMISRMDASVGTLMARLQDPNGDSNSSDSILNNTLVIFSSDNGATIEDNSPVDFFDANGVFRGGKFELYEGGIHMPQFAYWNGTIAPLSVSDYRTDLADFMATAADLAGVDAPVGIDGTSLVPVLTGQGPMRERKFLVVEHQGSHGLDTDPRITRWAVIRQDGMKLIRYDDESQELFNLATDPSESSPLNLTIPANAQIAAELEAAAIAEDVTRGSVKYRAWSGSNGGSLQTAGNWSSPTAPDRYWSAVVANDGAAPAIAHVSADVTTLGVEIRGQSAMQVVNVQAGRTLTGLNEVRVGANGRVDLAGGTLASSRWVNIKPGGQVIGQGTVEGDVYNQGAVSPGRTNDTPAWPIETPPALPPSNLNTGVVTAATFDFTDVQDDVPVGTTSTISSYLEIAHGLDFGPSVGPRWGSGGTNVGNELNVIGHTATSLSQAITNGDYITFTVNPVAGAGLIPDSVSFQLWRNGGSAAKNFAILSSVGGFTAGALLAQATYTDTGSASQHMLSAAIPAVSDAISGPVEYRLYAWGATSTIGNTHINGASLNARFVSVPTLEFNFAGVQNQALLTALKRQDANIVLTSGLNYGPGLNASTSNNAGNELNVAGFSTGTTQQSALTGDDYLTFSVQPITGMAMFPDSVSFTFWRQSSGSAATYAVFSSIGGFTSGQQVAQAQVTTTGSSNPFVLSGTFLSPQPTTNPVEFRLYGWGAATAVDNTHVVATSMRARFASVVGVPIDPTGRITVQGDFYHLAEGQIAIDLGGYTAGTDYDQISVVGTIELAGNLSVSLADSGGGPFAPALNDSFSILTATQSLTGQFANVSLPQLPWNLDWQLNYLSNAVTLSVFTSGDFNKDGIVNGGDYIVWRKNNGGQLEYDAWRAHFGQSIGGGAGENLSLSRFSSVPEPGNLLLLAMALTAGFWSRRRR